MKSSFSIYRLTEHKQIKPGYHSTKLITSETIQKFRFHVINPSNKLFSSIIYVGNI